MMITMMMIDLNVLSALWE